MYEMIRQYNKSLLGDITEQFNGNSKVEMQMPPFQHTARTCQNYFDILVKGKKADIIFQEHVDFTQYPCHEFRNVVFIRDPEHRLESSANYGLWNFKELIKKNTKILIESYSSGNTSTVQIMGDQVQWYSNFLVRRIINNFKTDYLTNKHLEKAKAILKGFDLVMPLMYLNQRIDILNDVLGFNLNPVRNNKSPKNGWIKTFMN